MSRKRPPHRVAIVAPSPVSMFNLAIPELLFAKVEVDGAPGYAVTICSSDAGPVSTTGGLDLHVSRGLDALHDADTVLLAGTGERYEPDPRTVGAVREAAAAGKRIASICSGAFVLAEAGLLDGRSATTYWGLADELRDRYPALDLRGDVLYIQDGQVLVTAGSVSDCTYHYVTSTAVKPKDEFKTVKGPFEILNAGGIIAAGQPHIHITLSSAGKGAFGGHLEKGCRVLYLAEITILKYTGPQLTRRNNENGISLLESK